MARGGGIRATRAPEGATAARQYDRAAYRAVPLWPGITWGHDARCSCSWSVRDGVMQVKVKSGACLVHMAEPPVTVLLGELIRVLAEALEPENRARCGSASGYNRHWLDGTKTCPACREAKNRARGRVPAAEAA